MAKPLPYTASPLRLVLKDTMLFLKITFVLPVIAGLPSIVLPILPFRSGPLDELYPSFANLWAVALHIVLVFAQVLFVLSLLPFAITLPGPVYGIYVIGFVLSNNAVSVLLNGPRKKFRSDTDMKGWPDHDDEKWFFINGVAVGQHWLQSNLNRIALTFRRPVDGIQNRTRGILFDVLQCVIQRDFGYATNDIRNGYSKLVDTLSDPACKKVVLILHSQGAIEGSTILDWLFATLPSSQLERLEVYTFGNAANHFNSPKCADSGPGDSHIVKHIEHYVNTFDWVSKFGILYYRADRSRFYGRLYERPDSGHQLNGNYLDNMFTMDSSLQHVLETNPFVESIQGGKKVKDTSRLWRYRDGMSPKD